MTLPPHKIQFLELCDSVDALKFGTFTLKSGRKSPYFFNMGLFHSASLLRALTYAYAQTLATYTPKLDFEVLFGPAYKAIPLAAATIDKLAEIDPERFSNVCFSFNRKEKKDHGEGGTLVGAPLKGKRVVIVDDVITAGTAIREAIDIIKAEGGELVGIVVAIDRQEKTTKMSSDGKPVPPEQDVDDEPRESAIGQLKKQYGIPIIATITLDDVVEYLKAKGGEDQLKPVEEYRRRYKAID